MASYSDKTKVFTNTAQSVKQNDENEPIKMCLLNDVNNVKKPATVKKSSRKPNNSNSGDNNRNSSNSYNTTTHKNPNSASANNTTNSVTVTQSTTIAKNQSKGVSNNYNYNRFSYDKSIDRNAATKRSNKREGSVRSSSQSSSASMKNGHRKNHFGKIRNETRATKVMMPENYTSPSIFDEYNCDDMNMKFPPLNYDEKTYRKSKMHFNRTRPSASGASAATYSHALSTKSRSASLVSDPICNFDANDKLSTITITNTNATKNMQQDDTLDHDIGIQTYTQSVVHSNPNCKAIHAAINGSKKYTRDSKLHPLFPGAFVFTPMNLKPMSMAKYASGRYPAKSPPRNFSKSSVSTKCDSITTSGCDKNVKDKEVEKSSPGNGSLDGSVSNPGTTKPNQRTPSDSSITGVIADMSTLTIFEKSGTGRHCFPLMQVSF